MERGCPANATRSDGSTALFMAAAQGHEGLVRRLLSYDRSIRDLARGDGATPLFAACKANNAGCAFALLESGACINLRRNDGASPLCIAALGGHVPVVRLLCGVRADFTAEFGHKTALAWAQQRAGDTAPGDRLAGDEGEDECVRIIAEAAAEAADELRHAHTALRALQGLSSATAQYTGGACIACIATCTGGTGGTGGAGGTGASHDGWVEQLANHLQQLVTPRPRTAQGGRAGTAQHAHDARVAELRSALVAAEPHAVALPALAREIVILKEEMLHAQTQAQAHAQAHDVEPPAHLTCAITQELMREPVFTADGHTYERAAISEWLRANHTSPNTGQRLRHKELTPNVMARGMVSAWLDAHPSMRERDDEGRGQCAVS